jgi:subtilase family serine protease
VQNRIVNGVGKAMTAMPQSVPARALKASDLGEARSDQALPSITLRFNMTAQQKAALQQLLIDQQDPASPQYHQWLTPEQFADQFGMTSEDVARVSQWVTGQGFKITSSARGRSFIQFSGTVAQAEAAFHTSIHSLSVVTEKGKGDQHIANITPVSLPSGIAAVVGSIGGLNDFRLKPHLIQRKVAANAAKTNNPNFTISSTTGGIYHFLAPGDFYTIYDVNPLLTSSINGSGIKIAVAGQTDVSIADITAFRAASGLSVNNPTVKLYGSDPGTPLTNGTADDETEADLDLEWSGAVAPSASIVYANSTDVINSLTQIIDNDLAPIATISYGLCEAGTGQSDLDSINALLMQANAQGQTVVAASGDEGATDCEGSTSTTATTGLAVDFPASSPYVTGIGGTSFNEGAGTYFNSTNGSFEGSAISYIPEAVWNESATNGIEGGGGGLSAFFTKPSWQVGTGVPNDFARDVPDVSLSADPDHDGYLLCSQNSCTNGFIDASAGTLDIVGGTSVGAPAFAGILALVEQKIGTSIGNANPTIYALANSTYYTNVFHDVTVGDNAMPCTAGSTDCPNGGNIGYDATVGYDLASGWGSVDAYNLASDWTLVSGSGSGSGIGTTVSTTTLTASAVSVTSGTSVTLTATVAGSGSSTVPTGTVQFLVDNVASGGAVTLTGGVATFTLATTILASGNHIVSAAYSGDSTYAGSKASVNIDVTSATNADFTLTPATTTVTVASGKDAPGVTFTVTPVNGFTGSVAFSASTTSSTLDATYSFTVTPVVISSTTAGTTVLDLSAYVANVRQNKVGLVRKPLAAENRPPSIGGHTTWYAGSGAALACVVLLMVPRRRRMGALLGLMLTFATIGGSMGLTGCGGGSSSSVPGQSNATPGTYTINVSATSTTTSGTQVTHNATVTFVVQ